MSASGMTQLSAWCWQLALACSQSLYTKSTQETARKLCLTPHFKLVFFCVCICLFVFVFSFLRPYADIHGWMSEDMFTHTFLWSTGSQKTIHKLINMKAWLFLRLAPLLLQLKLTHFDLSMCYHVTFSFYFSYCMSMKDE